MLSGRADRRRSYRSLCWHLIPDCEGLNYVRSGLEIWLSRGAAA